MGTIVVVAAFVMAPSVPTAGEYILDQSQRGPAQSSFGWVASQDEQDELEADMDEARGALGHDDEVVGEDGSGSEQERLERDMVRARRHIGEPGDEDDPRGPRRRRARGAAGGKPLHDGHGKAYYLTWGIVDWAIAGQSWVGGAILTVASILIYANAEELAESDDDDLGGMLMNENQEDTFRTLGIVYGVMAVGAAVLGTVFAFKAQNNLEIYRDLASRERIWLRARRSDSGQPDPHRFEPDLE